MGLKNILSCYQQWSTRCKFDASALHPRCTVTHPQEDQRHVCVWFGSQYPFKEQNIKISLKLGLHTRQPLHHPSWGLTLHKYNRLQQMKQAEDALHLLTQWSVYSLQVLLFFFNDRNKKSTCLVLLNDLYPRLAPLFFISRFILVIYKLLFIVVGLELAFMDMTD